MAVFRRLPTIVIEHERQAFDLCVVFPKNVDALGGQFRPFEFASENFKIVVYISTELWKLANRLD